MRRLRFLLLLLLLSVLMASTPAIAPVQVIHVQTTERWQVRIAAGVPNPTIARRTILDSLVLQGCTYANAPHRTVEGVVHNGAPFGEILAWSCASRAELDAALAEQRGIMDAKIAAFDRYMAECRAWPADQQHGCPWPRS